MGQYFLICNHKKKEFLHPHAFDDGAKFMEFASGRRTMFALAYLLSTNGNGRGWEGSWCGEPVGIHGDYATDGMYDACRSGGEYLDISAEVIAEIAARYPEMVGVFGFVVEKG